MRFLALLILAVTFATAEETIDQTKLPLEVQKSIAAYDSSVAKIAAKANLDVQKEKEKMAKALDAAMVKATKAGDLNGAMAIKKTMEKLNKSDEIVFDLLGDKPISVLILGKWNLSEGGWVEFQENGKASSNWDTKVSWKQIDPQQISLMIGNFEHTITIIDDNNLKVVRSDKKEMKLIKQQ